MGVVEDKSSEFDLERMERDEMIYRVSFFYDKDHKTIVNLSEQDIKDLNEAFNSDVSSFIIEDFGKNGNTLYINLKAVRFTVVQESESSEGTLLELSRLPELSHN